MEPEKLKPWRIWKNLIVICVAWILLFTAFQGRCSTFSSVFGSMLFSLIRYFQFTIQSERRRKCRAEFDGDHLRLSHHLLSSVAASDGNSALSFRSTPVRFVCRWAFSAWNGRSSSVNLVIWRSSQRICTLSQASSTPPRSWRVWLEHLCGHRKVPTSHRSECFTRKTKDGKLKRVWRSSLESSSPSSKRVSDRSSTGVSPIISMLFIRSNLGKSDQLFGFSFDQQITDWSDCSRRQLLCATVQRVQSHEFHLSYLQRHGKSMWISVFGNWISIGENGSRAKETRKDTHFPAP